MIYEFEEIVHNTEIYKIVISDIESFSRDVHALNRVYKHKNRVINRQNGNYLLHKLIFTREDDSPNWASWFFFQKKVYEIILVGKDQIFTLSEKSIPLPNNFSEFINEFSIAASTYGEYGLDPNKYPKDEWLGRKIEPDFSKILEWK